MASGGPGFRNQAGMRTLFRVVGVLAMGTALVLITIAIVDFFATMNSDAMEGPSRFWMFFLALPFFFVGGICLNAGFGGAGMRYAAGEAAPVAKDPLTYLRDEPQAARCASCQSPLASGARFCATCGTAVG